MNCVERYLAKAAGVEEAKAGQDLSCKVSYVAAHDVTAPIAIDMFRKIGVKKVFDPDRVALIVDHIYPANSEKARNNVWTMKDFADEFGVHLYHRGEGVIHQLMYEKHRAQPGELVVIADSHTGTCGGYGAVGVGVGSTELAAAMATCSGDSSERIESAAFGPTPVTEVSILKQPHSLREAKPNRSRASFPLN